MRFLINALEERIINWFFWTDLSKEQKNKYKKLKKMPVIDFYIIEKKLAKTESKISKLGKATLEKYNNNIEKCIQEGHDLNEDKVWKYIKTHGKSPTDFVEAQECKKCGLYIRP